MYQMVTFQFLGSRACVASPIQALLGDPRQFRSAVYWSTVQFTVQFKLLDHTKVSSQCSAQNTLLYYTLPYCSLQPQLLPQVPWQHCLPLQHPVSRSD